ncbi:MAG: hypothetical protein ACOX6X_00180 [Dethiobacteria bacterium]|jgi:hypothetical protein
MNNYCSIIKKYLVLLSLTFFLVGFKFSNSMPTEKESIYAYNMYNLGRIIANEHIAQNTNMGFTREAKTPDLNYLW